MSLNQIVRQSINVGENMTKIPFEMAREMLSQNQSNQTGTQNLMLNSVNLGENLATIPFRVAREMFQDSRNDENIIVINNDDSPENPS